ncbi:hypothetical protein GDI1423 [Gluconacetobacter diazotrophicus PA1 5]|uniref:Uncharacterized protein n=1 Tax=Gluconacetobacter diazotrophicus (strain ATCC 49037 / DSM 5601 / CCUG 37298 / CIP 103539 / LMG 7603 / PAl5) TaxID=272568 RepID=A9HFI3_GLUDA|nr:hypothetical protein GDI1423 [Gluconacetobacter diazotrophicus PA1 5]
MRQRSGFCKALEDIPFHRPEVVQNFATIGPERLSSSRRGPSGPGACSG